MLPTGNGWGESSVDEVVALLEHAYADRAEARRIGLRAAEAMRDWSWSAKADRIAGVLME